jgi:hypothetical protein
MNYEFDLERGIFTWVDVFSALSLPQFHKVAEFLDFPVPVSAELRQIAHDFTLSFFMLIMNHPDDEGYYALQRLLNASVPETLSINLLEGLPTENTDDAFFEREKGLFARTFNYLEVIGIAEEIYRWGRQTQTYYRDIAGQKHYFDFEALDQWFHRLRRWALLEWLTHNLNWKQGDNIGVWTDVINTFAPIHTRNATIEESYAQLHEFPLPDAAYLIQTIVLDHDAQMIQLIKITHEMKSASQSLWEDFLTRSHAKAAWLRSEGVHRLNLKAWLQIYDLLSLDEMHILEEWMRQHQDDYSRLKVPLPDFRAILYGID